MVTGPAAQRGMVFQQPALFPWKTVRENVAYGPRMAGLSNDEARQVADGLLEMVGLAAFGDKRPQTLSGGMQQRVAIARALANTPSILLMDEPFGALDAQTRAMMQENLLQIWHQVGITVVFVTHDIDEAIFLADRILVMSAGPGRFVQEITVDIERPRLPEIAIDPRFVDIQFADLIADPIGMVRRIYAASKDQLSSEAEARMRAWSADNRQEKHGRHDYDAADFGFDLADLRRRVAVYQARYDVPTDPRFAG